MRSGGRGGARAASPKHHRDPHNLSKDKGDPQRPPANPQKPGEIPGDPPQAQRDLPQPPTRSVGLPTDPSLSPKSSVRSPEPPQAKRDSPHKPPPEYSGTHRVQPPPTKPKGTPQTPLNIPQRPKGPPQTPQNTGGTPKDQLNPPKKRWGPPNALWDTRSPCPARGCPPGVAGPHSPRGCPSTPTLPWLRDRCPAPTRDTAAPGWRRGLGGAGGGVGNNWAGLKAGL